MPSQTNEQALEAIIEKKLAGITVEELKEREGAGKWAEAAGEYRAGNGYYQGVPKDFDKEYALEERRFWHFLESTQKEELDKLRDQAQWQLRIKQRLDRMIKKNGILYVLRKGLNVDDAHLTLLFAPPLASSSQEVKERFEKNEFSVTRQLRYSSANPGQEIDMVIFINGLPIATIELKNHWTGQSAKVHGVNQYKFERDATQPLLQFGR